MRAIGTSSPPPLIPASSAGHPGTLRSYSLRRADVNAKDKDWITALHGGEHSWIDVKIVELPLKEGAKVVMALWLATREWRADVTRSLLMKDADANNARSDSNEVGRGG